MKEMKKWIKMSETQEADYTGLLQSHNSTWCTEFSKSKTAYHDMLVAAVLELEQALNKMEPPSQKDFIQTSKGIKKKKLIKSEKKVVNIKEGVANLDDVDVTYDK